MASVTTSESDYILMTSASADFAPIVLDIIRDYANYGLNLATTISRANPDGENVYLRDTNRLLELAKTWELSMSNEPILYSCVGECLVLITERYQDLFLTGSVSPECDKFIRQWVEGSN